MKIVVAHTSPDWDAIGSVWLIKKYLPGWQDAQVEYIPAGKRSERVDNKKTTWDGPIEKIKDLEVIHVDTGLGPLDHHQVFDTSISAAGLTWKYVKEEVEKTGTDLTDEHKEAVSRIIQIIVDTDHFKELFWDEPAADYHEFSLLGLLDGLKLEKPDQDNVYMDFGIECLNALVHEFENRIWAEKEIKNNGIRFKTKYGSALGFESLNDTVIKLGQKMGYVLIVRKDPRKGYIRIKARPGDGKQKGIDLTLAYEKLKKMDPEATWFLHVSKNMLLNGTTKNPDMKPTKLSLTQIIEVLKQI